MSYGDGIRGILIADTDVTDIIGTGDNARLWPMKATQKAQGSRAWITYQQTDFEEEGNKDSASCLDTHQVDIDLFAKTYEDLIALSKAVRNAMNRFNGIINDVNIRTIVWNDIREFYEEGTEVHHLVHDIEMQIFQDAFVGSPNHLIQGVFPSGVDTLPQITITNEMIGIFTGLTDDGSSGSVVVSVNSSPISPSVSSPVTLVEGDTIDATRTISTAQGFYTLRGR